MSPSRRRIASPESFQPWLSRPRRDWPLVLDEARRRRGRRTRRSSRARRGRSATAGRPAPRRPSSARTRRAASATAASRRPCRSTACAGSRRSGRARRCAARAGSCPAGRRASRPSRSPADGPGPSASTARPAAGRDSSCRLVMIESRPKRQREPRHAGRDVALAVPRAGVDEQPQVGARPLRARARRTRCSSRSLTTSCAPRAVHRLRLVARDERRRSTCSSARRRRRGLARLAESLDVASSGLAPDSRLEIDSLAPGARLQSRLERHWSSVWLRPSIARSSAERSRTCVRRTMPSRPR